MQSVTSTLQKALALALALTLLTHVSSVSAAETKAPEGHRTNQGRVPPVN